MVRLRLRHPSTIANTNTEVVIIKVNISDISDVNDVNVELLKFKFLTRNTNKSKPLQLPVDINDVNVELLKFKFKSAKTVVISPHARVIFVNDFIKNKGPHLVRTSLKLSLNASKPLENEKPGGGGAP